MMDQIIRKLTKFANIYLDDLIIYRSTCEEHQTHLREVLEKQV